jgi:hypothetical protein
MSTVWVNHMVNSGRSEADARYFVIARHRPWLAPGASREMTFICHPELARDLGAAGRLLKTHRLPRQGASLRYASFSMTGKGCHWQERAVAPPAPGSAVLRTRRGNVPQPGPLQGKYEPRSNRMEIAPSPAQELEALNRPFPASSCQGTLSAGPGGNAL